MFSANQAPGTSDQSSAFYCRWLILPMRRQVGDEHQDRKLIDRLSTPEELSGLLRLAVAGLKRLHERGRFAVAETMQVAAEEYRNKTDTVSAFVSDRCTLDESARTRSGDIYEDYRSWCFSNGRQPLGAGNLRDRLTDEWPVRYVKKHDGGYPHYFGIELRGSRL